MPRKTRYPFAQMEVGDSFFYSDTGLTRFSKPYVAARQWGPRNNMKFSIRKVIENGEEGMRLWRVG